MEDDLLSSKSAVLNVNHVFKNTFAATSRLVSDQTVSQSLASLTHKINYALGRVGLKLRLTLQMFLGTWEVPGTVPCIREKGELLWPLLPPSYSRPIDLDQTSVAVTLEVYGDIRENTLKDLDRQLGVWGKFSTDPENSRYEPGQVREVEKEGNPRQRGSSKQRKAWGA